MPCHTSTAFRGSILCRPSFHVPCQGQRSVVCKSVTGKTARMEFTYPYTVLEASNLPAPLRSDDLVFYTHGLCPFAERVWLSLLHHKVQHTLVHVDLSRKPQWFATQQNPRGLVPCIHHDNAERVESDELSIWIEDTWGSSQEHRSSESVQNIMRSASDILRACLDVVSGDSGVLWAVGRNSDSAQVSKFLEACYQIADSVPLAVGTGEAVANVADASCSPSTTSFIGGTCPCVADFIVWPFISRALLALKHFNADSIIQKSSHYDSKKHQKFESWVHSMQHLHAVQMAAVDEGSLVEAWRRTGRLDWFDYETVNAGQLHPQLIAQQ